MAGNHQRKRAKAYKDDWPAIRRLYDDGLSRAEIARRLGVSKSSVSYAMKAMGYGSNPRWSDEALLDALIEAGFPGPADYVSWRLGQQDRRLPGRTVIIRRFGWRKALRLATERAAAARDDR